MKETPQSITHKAIKSTKWVFLSTVISKIWQPVITIILARLLSPEDFGLLALAIVVTSIIALFQDLGLAHALIQRREHMEEAADVIFWSGLVLGIFWYGAIFISAPFAAYYFHDERVISVLRIIGISFVVNPFGIVQKTSLTKELHFKELFYLNLIPTVVPGIVSIILAIEGFGVWALVLGSLMSPISSVVIVWFKIPWRPRWRYNLSIAKEMLGFGGFVSAESFLGWGITKIDNLFVGRFLGARQLGIYNMGWNVGFWPAQNLSVPIINIAYPMFSKLQQDMHTVRKHYLKIIELISLVSFPLGILIALTAHMFVPLLLGNRWMDAIPIIQLLSIIGILASIVWINPQIYRAIGRPDITPKFLVARSIISIPLYYFAAQKGIIFLCGIHLMLVAFFVPINIYIGMRVLDISLREIIGKLSSAINCSIIFIGAILILFQLLRIFPILSGLVSLSIIISLSALTYIIFFYLLYRHKFLETTRLLFQAIL